MNREILAVTAAVKDLPLVEEEQLLRQELQVLSLPPSLMIARCVILFPIVVKIVDRLDFEVFKTKLWCIRNTIYCFAPLLFAFRSQLNQCCQRFFLLSLCNIENIDKFLVHFRFR